MRIEELESLSSKDRDMFKLICNKLLTQTFIVNSEKKNPTKTNPEYLFIARNFDLIRDYLSYLDWELHKEANYKRVDDRRSASNCRRLYYSHCAKKVFIALGEEDENNPNAIKYYNEIIKKIRVEIPACNIFLIGLLGENEYIKNFNNNILSLCDNKKIKHIQFVSPKLSELGISKARFKQMSCFFRDKPLTMVEAFAMAN